MGGSFPGSNFSAQNTGGGGGSNTSSFAYVITCNGVDTVFDITHTLNSVNLSCSISQSEDNTGTAPFYALTINPKIVDANTVQYDLSAFTVDAGFKYNVLLIAHQ